MIQIFATACPLLANANPDFPRPCDPPSEDSSRQLFQLFDSNSRNLQKFSASKEPLKKMARCLARFVEKRKINCTAEQEWKPADQESPANAQDAGGCVYLHYVYGLTHNATKVLLEKQLAHAKNATLMKECLETEENKLRQLKPTLKEQKEKAKELAAAKAELGQLAKIREGLFRNEMAEAQKFTAASEHAYKNMEQLKARVNKCDSDASTATAAPGIRRFR